jgi:hypothetical protein
MTNEQLELFPEGKTGRGSQGEFGPPLAESMAVTSETSLAAALGPFQDHMIRQGFTENTIKAFLSDLRLLGKHVGARTPVAVQPQDLRPARDDPQSLFWLAQRQPNTADQSRRTGRPTERQRSPARHPVRRRR